MNNGYFMLSDLKKAVDDTLQKHGDMPVGVDTYVVGYKHNDEHSFPVKTVPMVCKPPWQSWHNANGYFDKAFVLSGD